MTEIQVVEEVMTSNDEIAASIRKQLDKARVLGLNLMASPGAGKTSILMQTVENLKNSLRIGALDGDLATLDVEYIAQTGIPVALANTGGNCHLDANMIRQALPALDLDALDLLLVENVGNLICPAAFALGTHFDVVIASVAEGDDKPYKYPTMFRGADVLLLNKIDMLKYEDFDVGYFRHGVEVLNPDVVFIPVSAKTGLGIDIWLEWVKRQVAEFKAEALA